MKPRKPFAHRAKASLRQVSGSAQEPQYYPPNNRQAKRPKERRGDLAAGTAWLYGLHTVQAALNNPERQFYRLLLTPEVAGTWTGQLPSQPEAELMARHDIDQILPRGAIHQGAALLVRTLPELALDEAAQPDTSKRNIVLLLDQVTDPQNVGAILRSAAAFGARAVILTERHAPEATGALAKAASGAMELVPLVRVVNLARALDELAAMGYWRIGLDGAAEKTLAEVVSHGNYALVLGAEGDGLRRLTREKCDLLAKLPISSAIESLNVSNAAACALYEFARQEI